MHIACDECDLLETVPPLAVKASARCRRCGALLYKRKVRSIERTLALTVAGLFLIGVANAYPFLGFEIEGNTIQTTLLGGIELLYQNDKLAIAAVVFFTAVLVPVFQLIAGLYVFLPLYLNRQPAHLLTVFRWIQRLRPWGMIEVFMVGILVSMIKLSQLATVIPGTALWAFAALIFVLSAASATLDPVEVWERLEKKR